MKRNVFVIALLLLSTLFATSMLIKTAKADVFIWQSYVYSTGEEVYSPTLLAGVEYRVESYEMFYYDIDNHLGADAQYYTTDPSDPWNWGNHFKPAESFLQINNNDVNWGPFSNGDTGHKYVTYYTGTGAPITLKIVDQVDGDYENNACHLYVKIYETPTRHRGLTPGFWKNHPDAWPNGYAPADSLDSVFGECAPDVTLMEALSLVGGPRIDGAKRILARHAVAALLNAETFGSAYPYTVGQLIEMVSEQFCEGTRHSILSLADTLDYWNNME